MPVLVDEQDLIIAGHGRVEAAKAYRHRYGARDRRARLGRGAAPSPMRLPITG
jgi:hypothetical protein